MSEDKQVMEMVNEHAARAQFEGRKDNPSVTAQGRASSPKGGAKGRNVQNGMCLWCVPSGL